MASLRPTLVKGVIRVGGRLEHAPSLSFKEKHPIILPKSSHVTKIVVWHCHEDMAHVGREQTLAETRKWFWIIGGRSVAKKTVARCILCQKSNARRMEQVMGQLPEARLIPYEPPFSHTGVDLFGPLLVKWGRSDAKRWGCIFTCLTSRAVFLEVTRSLSTDDFIMVLRQFVSRRGPPVEMRSDHGSNFTGADRELNESIRWNMDQIERELQQKGVRWRYNPPTAAHMSGVWERLVRSAKGHLKALAGERLLSDFALRTLFAEVEFILNNRPLSPVSEDIQDMEPLTPNHLLLQRKVVGLPPGVFSKEDHLRRKEWRKVQFLSNMFWSRWVHEYVSSLQERQKWRRGQRNIEVGDLVLLAEDDVPRNAWQLGRVVKAIKGHDDFVRSAMVKTSTGEYHRPIAKLCLLEDDGNL